LFGRIVPSDATTESQFAIRRNPKFKLQASSPSNPETLQTQSRAQQRNRLPLNGLAHFYRPTKQRRLVEFKDGCRYGKFGKTKAYELIAQERIRAYKMGGKTMIDLDSVDEYHASLPRVQSRAS
jgi:excisionase family DNA binding protein